MRMADGFSACHPCFMPDLRTASGFHLAGAWGWTRFMAKTRQPQATLLGVASKRAGISIRIQPRCFVFTASLLQRRMGYLQKQTANVMAEIAITPESIFDCVPLIQETIRSKSRTEYRALLYLLSLADDFDASLTLSMAFGCPAAEDSLINKRVCFPYWEEALRYKPEWGRVRRPGYGNPFFREIALCPSKKLYSRFLELCPPRDEGERRSLYNDVCAAQDYFLTIESPDGFKNVRKQLSNLLQNNITAEYPQAKGNTIKTVFETGSKYVVVETASLEEDTTQCKLVSLQGESLLPIRCTSIIALNGRFFIVHTLDNQRRVWDLDDRVFLDDKYKRKITTVLFSNSTDYLPVFEDETGNKGILLASGALLEHASYKCIWVYGPYLLVGDQEAPGNRLLDQQGYDIIPSEYDSIVYGDNPILELDMYENYNYDLIPVERDGEWYFVDKNNRPISNNAYAGLCPYSESGYAIFEDVTGKYGLIDREEKVVLAPNYKRLNWVGPSILEAGLDDVSIRQLISPRGEDLLPEGWFLDFPDNPYVFVRKKGRRAIFTQSIPGGKYDTLLFESKTCLIPENGCFIQFTNKGKKRLLNYDGTPVLKKSYDDIRINQDRSRILVKDGLKWFVLDNQGHLLNELVIKE